MEQVKELKPRWNGRTPVRKLQMRICPECKGYGLSDEVGLWLLADCIPRCPQCGGYGTVPDWSPRHG
jgi:rRNA maturation protein Nop10